METIISKLDNLINSFPGFTTEGFKTIPWGSAAEVYCDFYYKLDSLLAEHGYEFIGKGRQRRTYKRGNFVLKVPFNEDGEHSNYREHYTYKKNIGDIYAPCRLFGRYLMMVYVQQVKHNLPYWAGEIDCCQVGKTKAGKIVAYDFGF